MEKDFNKWNELKIKLENSNTNLFFNEGQIWWINIGLNLKQETCGKGDNFRRPVLILKKLSSKTFIGIPLSSKIKKGTWFVNYKQKGEESTALLYQIRMFDNIRFQRKIGQIDDSDFERIKKRLKMLLNL